MCKHRLRQNDCTNRGFVLRDCNFDRRDLNTIFMVQKSSALKRKRPKPKKVKKTKPKTEDDEDIGKGAKKTDSKEDDGKGDEGDGVEENGDLKDDGNEEQDQDAGDGDGQDEAKDPDDGEGEEEEQQKDEPEEEQDDAADDDGEGPKKEPFMIESFIFFEGHKEHVEFTNDSEDELKTSTQNFCDSNKIEYLGIDLTESNEYEGLEDLRLYIERVTLDLPQNHRPNNYLQKFEELQKDFATYYSSMENKKNLEKGLTRQNIENTKGQAKKKRLDNVMSIVCEIQKSETIDTSHHSKNTRSYLFDVLTPVISEGLLRIVEIRPTDPVDYLVIRA